MEEKFWEHEDKQLRRPTNLNTMKDTALDGQNSCYRLYFDGGCSKHNGVGGYILYSPDGQCLGGEGKWYGMSAPTNNISEA